MGERVNYGAGSITANYDGANKHRTVIEGRCSRRQQLRAGSAGHHRRRRYRGRRQHRDQERTAGALTVARSKPVTIANWKRPQKKTWLPGRLLLRYLPGRLKRNCPIGLARRKCIHLAPTFGQTYAADVVGLRGDHQSLTLSHVAGPFCLRTSIDGSNFRRRFEVRCGTASFAVLDGAIARRIAAFSKDLFQKAPTSALSPLSRNALGLTFMPGAQMHLRAIAGSAVPRQDPT